MTLPVGGACGEPHDRAALQPRPARRSITVVTEQSTITSTVAATTGAGTFFADAETRATHILSHMNSADQCFAIIRNKHVGAYTHSVAPADIPLLLDDELSSVLPIMPIKGDGNCLWYALRAANGDAMLTFRQLKASVLDNIETHLSHYHGHSLPLVMGESAAQKQLLGELAADYPNAENVRSELTLLKQAKTHASSLAVQGYADLFHTVVVVHVFNTVVEDEVWKLYSREVYTPQHAVTGAASLSARMPVIHLALTYGVPCQGSAATSHFEVIGNGLQNRSPAGHQSLALTPSRKKKSSWFNRKRRRTR